MLGESVILGIINNIFIIILFLTFNYKGYLKAFNPKLVTGWSSGTGLAGLFGCSFLLILRAFNITLTWVNLII